MTLLAQPEYLALDQAYAALQNKAYDIAVQQFEIAIHAAPARIDIRKDLAYTYLKIGETELARDQFRQAMELDRSDQTVALEFAFLSFETRDDPIPAKALARRIFDLLRRGGNTIAEKAFQNIDGPLREGIERWSKALEMGPESFSAHYELAQLAEQRNELPLAVGHYLRAWRMRPDRRAVLLDFARVKRILLEPEEAMAALLAASRGGEARTAEQARELLPGRYPYVYEFRAALRLDPGNAPLRRELAYLLLAMKDPSAVEEFRGIAAAHPDDLLSSAQLNLLTRRSAEPSDRTQPSAIPPLLMAKRSLEAGFLTDALRYLTIAHESDPDDYDVMLKLGWTNNMLHNDREAVHWFDLARESPDASISKEATKAYENLKPGLGPIRTTAWLLPFYSSRWNDVFAYGQMKAELNLKYNRIRPYVSARLIADAKPGTGSQPLSERSFILAIGLSAQWRRFTGWAEAGSAINYTHGSMVPDYRGGLSWSRAWNTESKFFLETNADEVFISRFGNDWLSYLQSRAGYRWLLFHANLTADTSHQHWANFVEAGPGVRFHLPNAPKSLTFSLSFLHGIYLINDGVPHHGNFNDFRAGFWYAITR